jgi:hypothetical protein
MHVSSFSSSCAAVVPALPMQVSSQLVLLLQPLRQVTRLVQFVSSAHVWVTLQQLALMHDAQLAAEKVKPQATSGDVHWLGGAQTPYVSPVTAAQQPSVHSASVWQVAWHKPSLEMHAAPVVTPWPVWQQGKLAHDAPGAAHVGGGGEVVHCSDSHVSPDAQHDSPHGFVQGSAPESADGNRSPPPPAPPLQPISEKDSAALMTTIAIDMILFTEAPP